MIYQWYQYPKSRSYVRAIEIYIFVAEVGNDGNVTKAPIESPFRARQPVSTSIATDLVAPGSNFPKYKVFLPNFLNIWDFSNVSWVFPIFFPYIFHLCPMFRGIFSHLFPSPTPPLACAASQVDFVGRRLHPPQARHQGFRGGRNHPAGRTAGAWTKFWWENAETLGKPVKIALFFWGRGYVGMGISAMWSWWWFATVCNRCHYRCRSAG